MVYKSIDHRQLPQFVKHTLAVLTVGLIVSSEDTDMCWLSSSETASGLSSSSLSSDLRALYFEECLVELGLGGVTGSEGL